MKIENVDGMNVDQLRSVLVDQFDYSQEDANGIKGKANLRSALKDSIRAVEGEQLFGEPSEIDSDPETELEEMVEEDNISSRNSPGWSDYVMSQFSDDEVMEKDGNRYPTLKGLRRVFYLLNGAPTFSGIIQYGSPMSEESTGRAHANYQLTYRDLDGSKITYCGAADAYSGNIAGGYHVYPLAIAENRAEARAYRKALMLNIVTAEEIGNETNEFTSVLPSSGEHNENSSMSEEQSRVVKTKLKQCNVDFDKFMDFMKSELGREKLSKKDGVECVKKVSYFSNNPSDIPEELKL